MGPHSHQAPMPRYVWSLYSAVQSLVWNTAMFDQWWSSLALNWETDLAKTTAPGNEFQSSTSLQLNAWFRLAVFTLGLLSFHLWPIALRKLTWSEDLLSPETCWIGHRDLAGDGRIRRALRLCATLVYPVSCLFWFSIAESIVHYGRIFRKRC